ncbi:hypothetical protein DHEL01_v212286 [Diaporthe helianthi]|uniref:Uncharacterized protein n=1 Tax=Diaporthe helianthi TaxID=158607 RepID=A0A2P5HGF0_DIAHE|nr:hypothetical protein DHEL01_v212286 [Diaporthe helianthi]
MYPIGKYKKAPSLPSRSPRSTSQDCSLQFYDDPLTPKRARKWSLNSSDPITPKRARKWSSNDKTPTSDINSKQDIKMEGPYKPDDEERDEYYYGLAGKPRLVARTSHNRWSRPKTPGSFSWPAKQIRKRFTAVSNSEIVTTKWTKDLDLALIKGLDGCRWSYFFPIHLDLEDTSMREVPTVLLVAVERDSLQWEEGVTIALECRRILQEFKIANVEVEIREGKYAPTAASAEFESQIDTAAWTCQSRSETNERALPMLSSLGYTIGYAEDHRKGEGSLGLHLRLGRENSALYGLTCRHVVSNGRQPDESYKVSEEHKQQTRQYHVQAGDKGFSECLKSLEDLQKTIEGLMEPLQMAKQRWEDWYQYDESLAHKRPTDATTSLLAYYQSHAAYNARVINLFSKISHKKDRQIGHLAFFPKEELSSEQPGYLKDWALIELDTNKFSSAPDNKVFIGNNKTPLLSKELLDNGFLQLQQGRDSEFGKPSMVAKRGFKTGLTFGIMNSIEAVVRRPGNGQDYFTWELLIVPYDKERVFSAAGDSGSSIFDMYGEVVGLVNGSNYNLSEEWRGIPKSKKYPGGTVRPEDAEESHDLATWPDGTDVTFASPIQWVLDDIARFTGLKPRLA